MSVGVGEWLLAEVSVGRLGWPRGLRPPGASLAPRPGCRGATPRAEGGFLPEGAAYGPRGSALLGPMLGRASKSPDSRLRGFLFSARICLICLGDAHSRLSGHLPGSCCWPCWSGPAHPSLHAPRAPHVSLSLCLSHLWGPPEGRDCV